MHEEDRPDPVECGARPPPPPRARAPRSRPPRAPASRALRPPPSSPPGNCGATKGLLQCSRCHGAWFCGAACQRAYWPFHRAACRRNEFAEAVEATEPRFARWMRGHGRLAVLKDDEVDRLERAAAAASGPGREAVMDSMYGRLQPTPAAPAYTGAERAAVAAREAAEAAAARRAAAAGAAYAGVELPRGLGADAGGYKWRQDQSRVEVFVPLPEGAGAAQVAVDLTVGFLSIAVDERPILSGALYREVKVEDSGWYVADGVLELSLLKRSRRGRYAAGATNADTFWRAVVRNAPAAAALAAERPPTEYYWAPCEGAEAAARAPRARRRAASPPATPAPAELTAA